MDTDSFQYALYPVFENYKDFIERENVSLSVFGYYGYAKKGTYKSPFRVDRTPSCTLYRAYDGKYLMHDHGRGKTYDCIELVMLKEGLSFPLAMEFIIENFIFNGYSKPLMQRQPNMDKGENDEQVQKEKAYKKIKIEAARWDKDSYKYWREQKIRPSTLSTFKVYPTETIRIEGKTIYGPKKSPNRYAYEIAPEEYQIYAPFEPKKRRFLCNTGSIMGMRQLPDTGKTLIISKSYKDIMTLHEMGLPAISKIGEANMIPEEEMEYLRFRFDNIFTFTDFDLTGISSANAYRKAYGTKPLFLTNGRFKTVNFESKDISDYVRDKTIKEAKNLVNALMK